MIVADVRWPCARVDLAAIGRAISTTTSHARSWTIPTTLRTTPVSRDAGSRGVGEDFIEYMTRWMFVDEA